MKILRRIIIVLIILIVALLLAKDFIIKASVEKGVEVVTGLKLSIGNLNVGILKPTVEIKNLKLFNPENFPDKIMIDMPEIYVNYDLPAIIGGTIHLPEVRLGLKEFFVVKNSSGEVNLNALKSVQAQKKGAAKPSGKPEGKAPNIKIDKLVLSIGKVIYKDYSKGATPSIKEYDINLNEVYTNVNDPYQLASLIVVKALLGTPIASLANFDLKGLQNSVGGVMSGAQKIAATAVEGAEKTATNAIGTVKDLLKNPFGSEK
ncbi:MAG: hypothetical protein PHP17_03885 [Candidatus Omnitrophica bacterium]|nr:hypothetical protein [Candidatus Omnitrophota bacterium]